ncbi:MAG TPA: cupin domain-containing protein [Candidatus Binatia bacterium]|nr:cupin domain-containing protein [Candidatus Binatia bacterium]
MTSSSTSRPSVRVFALSLVCLSLALLGTLAATVRPARADGPTVTVEWLTGPTAYPDEIDALVKVKLAGSGTQVAHTRNPDHVRMARITFDDGASLPWHTHPGPVVVSIVEGRLVITNAFDCLPRTYAAGQGFVEPGHGNVHRADALGRVVLYATFFEVPASGAASIPAADPGC